MVHLVAERPRDALLPVLFQQCVQAKGSTGRPAWRVPFPIYYELVFVGCNIIFLIGSVLFLPIFEERDISVNFSMAVENLDKGRLLTAHRALIDSFEQNISRAVAAEAGPKIQPSDTGLEWHQTRSCKVHDVVVLDSIIFPPWGVNVSEVQVRLASSDTLGSSVNASIATVGQIDDITTGPLSVRIMSVPHIVERPKPGKWAIDLGCYLFIFGSLIMALLTLYDMAEDLVRCSRGFSSVQRSLSRKSVVGIEEQSDEEPPAEMSGAFAEKTLYLVGSLVFLIGTLYWQHPKQVAMKVPTMEEEDVLFWAIGMFIVGSVTFVFAAFLNALSLSTVNSTFGTWAVAVCGIYEFGGILFVMGSVCFMPNQGCGKGMEVMGAWCFITGSLCYVFGSLVEVMKTVALLFLRQQQEQAAKKIAGAYSSLLRRRRLTSVVETARRTSSAGAAELESQGLLPVATSGSEQLPAAAEDGESEGEEEATALPPDVRRRLGRQRSKSESHLTASFKTEKRAQRQDQEAARPMVQVPKMKQLRTSQQEKQAEKPPGLFSTFFMAVAANQQQNEAFPHAASSPLSSEREQTGELSPGSTALLIGPL